MAAKGTITSDETKAKISASQKARWDRIRSKVELGETHETHCVSGTLFEVMEKTAPALWQRVKMLFV